MNIDIEWYKIFYVVAKNGNITASANELMISQPAISKTIKNLEEQLGGKLFTRTKKGVTLTEEGKTLYYYISQAMELIDTAEKKFLECINLEAGLIRIGSSNTIVREYLLPFIAVFHQMYPKIEIKILNNMSSLLLDDLKNGKIDLVFLNLPHQDEKDIIIKKLKKVQDCFAASCKLNLPNNVISLKDLNDYQLILQLPSSSARRFLDNFCLENNVTLKPAMELDTYSSVTSLTKAGFGIGYLTKEFIKEDLKNKTLKIIQVVPPIPSRYIGLAYSSKITPSFSTKKFIELLTQKNQ